MARKKPAWVPQVAVEAMHAELIAEHGGLRGTARRAALESALARARQLWEYTQAPAPSLTRLAACYGYALAKDHCFPDGNKRIALAVMDVFLQINGREITADEAETAAVIGMLADRSMTEESLADWLKEHCQVVGD